jgi:enoyl-[acyl-carrier protein] reductase I
MYAPRNTWRKSVTEESGAAPQLLAGKVAVVMGVANRWSIAYAIAEAMAKAGAKLAVTYLDDRTIREAEELVAMAPGGATYKCDVENDDDLDALQASLAADFGTVDTLVHSIAFAPPAELKGRFIETSRTGFQIAHSVSVYSLIACAQHVAPLMTNGGSIMTMTYLGADRVFPQYNVMGVAKAALEATVRYMASDLGGDNIRVNAMSAGPIKSAAARGIPGFMDMKASAEERTPLKGEFNAKKVAGLAVFLASDASDGITGETIFVDNGYHILGA